MEYTNTRQRTRWIYEIRAFAGAGLSTLTPDKGPSGEVRLKHLPGQDGLHKHQTEDQVER